MPFVLALALSAIDPITGLDTDVCTLPRVDPESASSPGCYSCHDGSIGPAADVTFAPTVEGLSELSHRAGLGTHPVDVDYEAAVLRRPGALVPLALLRRELVLPQGRVACVTCHNPGSREKYHVPITLSASALCLACHQY